jgi:hypothetical protein
MKATKSTKASVRNLFGHSVTAVARWMGRVGLSVQHARKIFSELGFSVPDSNLIPSMSDGRVGRWGKPAPLTQEQAQKLFALLR